MASIIKVGKKWRAQVRIKGMPPQTKTFSTKPLATEWARGLEGQVERTAAGVMAKTGPTIDKLIERYTEEVGKAKPFGKDKAYCLSRLAREDGLGLVRADLLTPERVVAYIREDRGIAHSSAQHDLGYLKGVLKIARALWRYPVNAGVVDDAREILLHMGLLNAGQRRDRRPTPEELEALRAWFVAHPGDFTVDHFDFILASCFRPPSECLRLRWEDLNEKDRTIVIRDRKDPRRKLGNDQVVPLLNGSFEIVMRQPREHDTIFVGSGNWWSQNFTRAVQRHKIEDLTLYDLRHEAISRLVESGKYSIPEMMLVSGHRDPKQLMTYTQLRAKDFHDR